MENPRDVWNAMARRHAEDRRNTIAKAERLRDSARAMAEHQLGPTIHAARDEYARETDRLISEFRRTRDLWWQQHALATWPEAMKAFNSATLEADAMHDDEIEAMELRIASEVAAYRAEREASKPPSAMARRKQQKEMARIEKRRRILYDNIMASPDKRVVENSMIQDPTAPGGWVIIDKVWTLDNYMEAT